MSVQNCFTIQRIENCPQEETWVSVAQVSLLSHYSCLGGSDLPCDPLKVIWSQAWKTTGQNLLSLYEVDKISFRNSSHRPTAIKYFLQCSLMSLICFYWYVNWSQDTLHKQTTKIKQRQDKTVQKLPCMASQTQGGWPCALISWIRMGGLNVIRTAGAASIGKFRVEHSVHAEGPRFSVASMHKVLGLTFEIYLIHYDPLSILSLSSVVVVCFSQSQHI